MRDRPDDDDAVRALRAELLALVAGFRVQLEHQARSGLRGVRGGASPRASGERAGPDDSSPGVEPGAARAGKPDPHLLAVSDRTQGLQAPHDPAHLLKVLRDDIGDCKRCKLAATRDRLVFGVGNPRAALMFVGEGPGRDENRTGEPFVGAAGQLLDRMIAAMGFTRKDVYICNVVKCWPPGNRNPEPDEVAACQPFLYRQIAAVRPSVIVALGKYAAHNLCGETTPITRLRGRFFSFQGIPVMPTYHPAYLLRNPAGKREVWDDLKAVMQRLNEIGDTRFRAEE